MDRQRPQINQQQPFLDHGRDSEDIELSQLDGNTDLPSHTHNHADNQGPSKLLIATALLITIAGFVINTEAAAYYEDVLGWKKPFASMYVTHSSLALPYWLWVRDYNNELRGSVASVEAFAVSGPSMVFKQRGALGGPLDYLATTMAIVTGVLTVSGMSWFLSLGLTTPSDLTAIYNCSTFFAAAFSVPLLRQKLGRVSIAAVALSIAGTFIIAYGNTTASHAQGTSSQVGTSRLLGNVIALVGAVAFGLYEVLFKKWACSSQPLSPQASLHLTFAASALTGIYTLATFWAVLIVLHILDIEPFVFPSLKVIGYIVLSVTGGSSTLPPIHTTKARHPLICISQSPSHLSSS
jgi:drug/metabolite transporter (DMT)-like permease